MMNSQWQRLRTDWFSSKHEAFEALVCQIAGEDEDPPTGSRFCRVKAPDAGVECYWILPNDEEWGWQAKFFSSMEKSQWEQLTRSFRTALEKRPALTRYIVCLPLDREEPKLSNKRSFMDRWNSWVEAREKKAEELGRLIAIEYWGDHELMKALALEKHKGRRRFFFDMEDKLGPSWFDVHQKNVEALAGRRYTPVCNVELTVARHFDTLGRTSSFSDNFGTELYSIIRAFSKASDAVSSISGEEMVGDLKPILSDIVVIRQGVVENPVTLIPIDRTAELVSELYRRAEEAAFRLRALEEKPKAENPKNLKAIQGNRAKESSSTDFSSERHTLNEAQRSVRNFQDMVYDQELQLANGSVLLLVGPAGSGKTHLLCDVARKRHLANMPTIMDFGQRFVSGERPLTQMMQHLDLKFSDEEEFLGALEAAGHIAGQPALIFIDAMNESPQWASLWKNYLPDLIIKLQEFPWVRLAVSVRSSYVERLLRDISRDQIVEVEHSGFSGHEYVATKAYFKHFGIEVNVPPLTREFGNPLFLKLFCEGLQKRGLKRPPDGVEGFSSVLQFYLESINIAISDHLRIDKSRYVVMQAVNSLAAAMANENTRSLPLSRAREIVEEIHKSTTDDDGLFTALLSEGVLAKDVFPWFSESGVDDGLLMGEQPKDEEVVTFAYDRFTDHLLARRMIGKFTSLEGIREKFRNTDAYRILADERNSFRDRKLIDALAIQTPEILGCEITEFFENGQRHDLEEAVLGTLMWRDPNSIGSVAQSLLEEAINEDGFDRETGVAIIHILLSMSCHPSHDFNADFLHNLLANQKMVERDAWWSTALHRSYEDNLGALHRLLDWAFHQSDAVEVDDEVALLWATALAWTLSTPNRFVRDRSTKALVALLDQRINLVRVLVERFLEIDDPYIRERVLAAAYGCALRSDDVDEIRELAIIVHEKIFSGEKAEAHILLRDYGRGIVEVAVHVGASLPFEIEEVRPPYQSPRAIPWLSRDEILEKYNVEPPIDHTKKREYEYNIAWDWMRWGDFATYQVNSLIGSFDKLPKTKSKSIYEESKCWMFLRMLDLGWNPKAFPSFDEEVARSQPYNNHVTAKSETMTKKYAWIALHELAGHLSDNELMDDYSSSGPRAVQGPWEIGLRDIDPSTLLVGNDSEWRLHLNNWWFPPDLYDAWASDDDHQSWLQDDKVLPDVTKLLRVHDEYGHSWILFGGMFDWDQPAVDPSSKEDLEKIGRRKLWIKIHAYFVKKSDSAVVCDWLGQQNFFGGWMPQPSSGMEDAFLGEFPWHPSFRRIDDPYYSRDEWTRGDDSSRIVPKPILVTSDSYDRSQGYDCSVLDGGVSIDVPSRWLVKAMNLNWSGDPVGKNVPGWAGGTGKIVCESAWFDEQGNLVALDPSLRQRGTPALLFREDTLKAFLRKHDYDVLWTAYGEKQVLGSLMRHNSGLLVINGSYRCVNNRWNGGLRANFEHLKSG